MAADVPLTGRFGHLLAVGSCLHFLTTRSLTQCSIRVHFTTIHVVSHLYRLLGKNIAHFRREANLTQEQLAEKTDYSVDFIGLVERGVNAPTVSRLKDIADVIGVEVWQLFYTDQRGQEKPRKSASRATQPAAKDSHRRSR